MRFGFQEILFSTLKLYENRQKEVDMQIQDLKLYINDESI